MKCVHCGYVLPPDSEFCPYCGGRVVVSQTAAPTTPISDTLEQPRKDRDHIVPMPRHFDSDYGYSPENPMVVSSVPMIGYDLTAFRTEDGRAFTWERQPRRDGCDVDEYQLFLAGEPYRTVFFRTGGNDTDYLPRGIIKDADAFDAVQMGISVNELLAQREAAQRDIERRKNRRKKLFRAALCILAAVSLGVGAYFGYTYGYPALRYHSAVRRIETNPQKAIEIFDDLGDYKNAAVLSRWAHYYNMKDLAAQGDYEAAIQEYDFFKSTDDSNVLPDRLHKDGTVFQDAETARADAKALLDTCYQGLAVQAIEAGEYTEALDLLGNVTDMEAASRIYAECYYHLVLQNYEAKDWAGASSFMDRLEKVDPQNEFDVSGYRYEILYNYAVACLEKGTKVSYSEGSKRVNQLIKLYGETSELLALQKRIEAELPQAKYSAAMQQMNIGLYKDAISSFAELGDFKDSKTQLLEAKYRYVHNTFLGRLGRIEQLIYYMYAEQLAERNYKDSRQFYQSLPQK